jgi:hypothetical protein
VRQGQPVPSVAVAIANALGISLSELAGTPSHRVSLTGDWWTCWQTSRGGVEDIRTQPVHLDQHGELIQIDQEELRSRGAPPGPPLARRGQTSAGAGRSKESRASRRTG